MRISDNEFKKYLDDLAASARAGDRLPTVRELMKRFELSQAVVQRIFHRMQEQGIISIAPGRGMFFAGPGAMPRAAMYSPKSAAGKGDASSTLSSALSPPHSPPLSRSVLLLRRSVNSDRGRPITEQLHRRFTEAGHKVIEVLFSDSDHAKAILKSLPRFDACVIQSVYHSIPSDMLATIHEKTDVIVSDGMTLVGADVDSIGTEWGEPLAEAVALLREHGHRHLCFATTSRALLASSLGLRRWEYLRKSLGKSLSKIDVEADLSTIRIPQLPDEGYAEALIDALRQKREENSETPFTALIAWGISDGARFRQGLLEAGFAAPKDLSVILLGRIDMDYQHAGFFHVIGTSIDDQVRLIFETICRRWQDPSLPNDICLAPVVSREGESIRRLDSPS